MTLGAATRISIFTTMPPGLYSGGRYLSLILAYSLSRAGADVAYITNNVPMFEGDFRAFEDAWPIRTIVGPNFEVPSSFSSDWVIVIPTGSFDAKFYDAALRHAKKCRARIALLSFETPNWYNQLSPFPRSAMPTEAWRRVVANGGLVISIAAEGVRFARDYFGAQRDDLSFGYWHPPINDLAAEAARTESMGNRVSDRRVTMFVRVEDPHKGAQDLLALPPNIFDGKILSLVFGRGVSQSYLDAVRSHFSSARDFAIEPLSQISDAEKFNLLGQSRLLLFPSYFEGFGYPPVEAAEMGVQSVAYDLPLLAEVSGGAVHTVPIGDVGEFAAAITDLLSKDAPDREYVRNLRRVPTDTLSAGRAMLSLLDTANFARTNASSPRVKVAGNALTTLPEIRRYLRANRGLPQLRRCDVSIADRYIEITGMVADAADGATAQFSMPGAHIRAVPLEKTGEEHLQCFSAGGIVTEWHGDPPSAQGRGTGSATLTVLVVDPNGRSHPVGVKEVFPDWPSLLLWPEGNNRVPQPTDDASTVLVAFDALALADNPSASAIIAAACDALDRQGRRTRLLLSASAVRPNSAITLDCELLPRVHGIETVDDAGLREAIDDAVAGGRPLLVGPGCQHLLPADHSLTKLGPDKEVASDRAVFVSNGGVGKGAAIALTPAARTSRRSLASVSRTHTVVLLPPVPIHELSQPVRAMLEAVERRSSAVDLLIPHRLWSGRAVQSFGLRGKVRPVSEAVLTDTVLGAIRPIGIVGDGPERDAPTASLLAAAGSPIIHVKEGSVAEVNTLLASLADDVDCPVESLIVELFPAGTSLLPTYIPYPAEPRSETSERLPCLAAGDIISFSSSLGAAPDAYLVSGWRERTIDGAIMADDHAAVAFKVERQHDVTMELELLLRSSSGEEVNFGIEWALNGREITAHKHSRSGAAVVTLRIPAEAWAVADMPQVLVLRRDREKSENDTTIVLGALSLRAVAKANADWSVPQTAAGHAPLMQPGALKIPAASTETYFRSGAPPGSVVPLAGWGKLEKDRRWSAGRNAALTLRRPDGLDAAPILVTLTGRTANIGDLTQQRIGIRSHGTRVFAGSFPPGKSTKVRVALGAASAAAEDLVLEFPDAASPLHVGEGEDGRTLAFALQSAQLTPLPYRVYEGSLKPEGTAHVAGRTFAEFRGHGALRLEGKMPLPDGAFAIGGSSSIYCPRAIDLDRWEVILPLPQMATSRLAVGWVRMDTASEGLDPADIKAEIWVEECAQVSSGQEPYFIALRTIEGDAAGFTLSSSGMAALDDWDELKPSTVLRLGTTNRDERSTVLDEGWSDGEPGGTWTDGHQATLDLPQISGPALLVLRAQPFVHESQSGQRLQFAEGQEEIALVDLAGKARRDVCVVLSRPPEARIVLTMPDATSPAEAGMSSDQRQLAIRLSSLALHEIGPLSTLGGVSVSHGSESTVVHVSESAVADRKEKILWFSGTGVPPAVVTSDVSSTGAIPRVNRNGEGWFAALAVPSAFRKSRIRLSLKQDSNHSGMTLVVSQADAVEGAASSGAVAHLGIQGC